MEIQDLKPRSGSDTLRLGNSDELVVMENFGSLTVDGKLVTPGIADARVDTVRGSVVVSSIVEKELYAIPADGAIMFGPESYHLHDYGFFFNNFKQNVAARVKAFLEKK